MRSPGYGVAPRVPDGAHLARAPRRLRRPARSTTRASWASRCRWGRPPTIAFDEAGPPVRHGSTTAARCDPRFVVDATGQNNQVARRMGTLDLRSGAAERRRLRVLRGRAARPGASRGRGSSRASPSCPSTRAGSGTSRVAPGLLSVGVVTSRDVLVKRAAGFDRRLLRREHVRACAELSSAPRQDATRVRYPGAERRRAGPQGLLLLRSRGSTAPAGRCAGTPPASSIRSSRSAATWRTRPRPTSRTSSARSCRATTIDEALCLRAYEEQVQFSLRAFRRMTYMFYGFNDSKESWWWEAKRILSERALPCFGPRQERVPRARDRLRHQPARSTRRRSPTSASNLFDDFYRHLVSPRACSPRRRRGVRPRHLHGTWSSCRGRALGGAGRGTGRVREVTRDHVPGSRGNDADSRRACCCRRRTGASCSSSTGSRRRRRSRALTVEERGRCARDARRSCGGLVDMGVLAAAAG